MTGSRWSVILKRVVARRAAAAWWRLVSACPARWLVVCGVVCVSVMFSAPALAAGGGDVGSTSSYLRADYVLTRAVLSHAKASVADMEKEASGIAVGCPSVLVGAPKGEQLDELGTELTIAVLLASAEPDKNVSLGFASKVDALRWSNRKIAGLVRSVAAEERVSATVKLPDVCADIRAWVASGYHTLPASVQHFLNAAGGIGQETNEGGKEESVEEDLLQRLRPYENPSDRPLAKRLKRLNESVGNRLGPAWLKAVGRAGQALNPKT